MHKTRLGRTELWVSRTAFGALPIQRVDFDTAKIILRQAYEGGITFFDSARGYSDSEEKLGYALSDVRDKIYISTKSSGATNRESLLNGSVPARQVIKPPRSQASSASPLQNSASMQSACAVQIK